MKRSYFLFFFSIACIPMLFSQETNFYPEQKTNDKIIGNYSMPGRINVEKSQDFFTHISFIYWQPKEAGLEPGEYDPINTTSDFYETLNMPLDYHPGFKVGMGYNFNCDDWNLNGEYLRLHTSDSSNYSAPAWADDINDYWTTTGNASSMHNTFKFHTDMLQLYLGRYFYSGKRIILHPKFGLKGGWINQWMNVTSVDSIHHWDVIAKYKSKSWLIGPIIGVDSNWLLGKGFSFLGNVSVGLFYQHFRTKTNLQDDDSLSVYYNYKFNPHFITPNANINIGLEWGSYFFKKAYHFNLAASYEFQFYWNQNVLRALYTDPIYAVYYDLMLHGLTIKAQFDF